MTRPTRIRMVAWAVVAPLLGLLGGLLLARAAPPETGQAISSYALALMPLSVLLGALGGYRAGLVRAAGRRAGGLALLGVLVTAGAAVVVANGLATIRFWRDGATGFLPLTSLLYAREMLFLIGPLPGAALLGATIVQLAGPRRGVWIAGLAGALTAFVTGPALILVAGVGRLGANPIVVTGLAIIVVVLVGRRRSPDLERAANR